MSTYSEAVENLQAEVECETCHAKIWVDYNQRHTSRCRPCPAGKDKLKWLNGRKRWKK